MKHEYARMWKRGGEEDQRERPSIHKHASPSKEEYWHKQVGTI